MDAAVHSNNPIGFNVTGHPSSTPRVSIKFQQVEQSAGEVHQTIAPKISVISSNTSAAKSNAIPKADVKTPQNAQNENWLIAKRVAVVALPVIGLAAFIGLSIGVGMATGGIGFLPLLAGGILLATFSASVAITLTTPNLWNDIPMLPQGSEMKAEDKEEKEVTDNSSEVRDLADSAITLAELQNDEEEEKVTDKSDSITIAEKNKKRPDKLDINDLNSTLFDNDTYINSLVEEDDLDINDLNSTLFEEKADELDINDLNSTLFYNDVETPPIVNNESVNNEDPIAASPNSSDDGVDKPVETKKKPGVFDKIVDALTPNKDDSKKNYRF